MNIIQQLIQQFNKLISPYKPKVITPPPQPKAITPVKTQSASMTFVPPPPPATAKPAVTPPVKIPIPVNKPVDKTTPKIDLSTFNQKPSATLKPSTSTKPDLITSFMNEPNTQKAVQKVKDVYQNTNLINGQSKDSKIKITPEQAVNTIKSIFLEYPERAIKSVELQLKGEKSFNPIQKEINPLTGKEFTTRNDSFLFGNNPIYSPTENMARTSDFLQHPQVQIPYLNKNVNDKLKTFGIDKGLADSISPILVLGGLALDMTPIIGGGERGALTEATRIAKGAKTAEEFNVALKTAKPEIQTAVETILKDKKIPINTTEDFFKVANNQKTVAKTSLLKGGDLKDKSDGIYQVLKTAESPEDAVSMINELHTEAMTNKDIGLFQGLKKAAMQYKSDLVTGRGLPRDPANEPIINALDEIISKPISKLQPLAADSTIRGLAQHARDNGGITADFNGNIKSSGYAFSVLDKADETKLTLDQNFDTMFMKKFAEFKAKYGSNPANHMGGWVDNGQFVADVSHVSEDLNKSIYEAILKKQDAIGDLGKYAKGENGDIFISKKIINSIEPLSTGSFEGGKSSFKNWDEVKQYYNAKDFKNPAEIDKLATETNNSKKTIQGIKSEASSGSRNNVLSDLQTQKKDLLTPFKKTKTAEAKLVESKTGSEAQATLKDNQPVVKKSLFGKKSPSPESIAGKNLKNNFIGQRDVRITETNQLANDIDKLIPKGKDREATFIYHELRNNPQKTAEVAQLLQDGDKKLAPYAKIIQKALNPTPEMTKASDLLKDYFKSRGAEGTKLGYLKGDIENYITHIIQNGEKSKEFASVLPKAGMSRTTQFGQGRKYETIIDTILGGHTPATLDASNVLRVYGQRDAVANATVKFIEDSKAGGFGKWMHPDEIPENWTRLDPFGRKFENVVPFISKEGEAKKVTQVFAVPNVLADAMKPIIEPDWLKRVGGFGKWRMAQSWTKFVNLSLSFFHAKALTITAINSDPKIIAQSVLTDMTSSKFKNVEKDLIQHGGTTPILGGQYNAYRDVQKGGNILVNNPMTKAFNALARKTSGVTFEIMQRKYKVLDYSNKTAAWIAKHPEATMEELNKAKEQAATYVNGAYGGLNWEKMGFNKSQLTMLRTVLLAPDWTFSNLIMPFQAARGVVSKKDTAKFLVSGFATGIAATQLTNLMMNGKMSDDPFNVNIGKRSDGTQVKANMFFAGNTKDLVNLFTYTADLGIVGGVIKFGSNKAAPYTRQIAELMTNKDYWGNPIFNEGKGFLGNTLGAGQYALTNAPLPFAVTSPLRLAGGTNGAKPLPAEIALASTGLASITTSSPAKDAYKGAYDEAIANGKSDLAARLTAISAQNKMKDLVARLNGKAPTQAELEELKGTKSLYTYLKTIPTDQANKFINDLQSRSPATVTTLTKYKEIDNAGMGAAEYSMVGSGIKDGSRATLITNQLNTMATKQQKNDYINKLYDVGIMNDDVYNQLGTLKTQGKLLPLGQTSNTKLDVKTGKPISNGSLIDSVMTYATAIGTDPATAFDRIISGQKITRVTNGTVIVERMPLDASQNIKIQGNANNPTMKLDHTIPLELGGSNAKSNLKIVSTKEWESYTPVENALGEALINKKIDKAQAQTYITQFKAGKIKAEEIYKKLGTPKKTSSLLDAFMPQAYAAEKTNTKKVIEKVPANMKTAATKNIPLIQDAFNKEGITNKRVIAYALATAEHESGFVPKNEIGGASQAKKLGYEGGANYAGRGFIQLTGFSNYKKIGQYLGIDLVNHPEKLNDPATSARAMAAYFKLFGTADSAAKDFLAARRSVNGGEFKTGSRVPYNIARRANEYLASL